MLAMDSSASRLSSSHALFLTTIAGKPTPTGERVRVDNEVTSKAVEPQKKTASFEAVFYSANNRIIQPA